jgi:hypothetical protein
MEIVDIKAVDGESLEIKVSKRYRRLICIRGCNVMRLKTANFSGINAGEIVYDAIVNEVGSLFFRKSVYGEYYCTTITSFFSEYDESTLTKVKKVETLRVKYREIFDEINLIEESIKSIE